MISVSLRPNEKSEVKHHVNVNLYHVTKYTHYLSVTVPMISTHKLVVSRNFLSIRFVFIRLFFIFWEILNLNRTFAVYVKLKLLPGKVIILCWFSFLSILLFLAVVCAFTTYKKYLLYYFLPTVRVRTYDFQYNFVFIANKTLWSVHLGVDALGVCEVFYVY